jgi:septum formation protein
VSLLLVTPSLGAAALLRAAGFEFDIVPAGTAADMDVEETPDGYVRRIALTHVGAVEAGAGERPVLASATVHTLDGHFLDAPGDAAAARSRLQALSGRDHQVTTAVCLSFVEDGARRQHTKVERTTVTMATLRDAEIDWYVRSGEPIGVPGGYVMDGRAARFITRIQGSPGCVAGMPVATAYQLMIAAGLPLPVTPSGSA